MTAEQLPHALSCPHGHTGPWRYVEQVEVWRDVIAVEADTLVIDAEWHTGESYNDGVPGTGYLLGWHGDDGVHCVQRVEIPPDTQLDWQ